MIIKFACPKCTWNSMTVFGKHPADPHYTDIEFRAAWKHVREEHAKKCSGTIVSSP